ncbi:MAG: GAF domain-containing protein [Ktedonobacteraceae bacterium]
MTTTPYWQNVLKQIIKASSERRRLATALGLSEMALARWTNEGILPQRSQITRLVQIVQPQYRQELIEALEAGPYPNIQFWLREGPSEQITTDFYSHTLSLRTTTTESLRFWQISEAILLQVLEQLDPNRQGMSITLVQCMPPSRTYDNKIRSLREVAGKGTPPWDSDLTHLSLFLGMESLAGYVVEARHEATIEDLSKDHLVPAYRTENEVSAAVYPIMLGDSIVGCLSASSTQRGYFTQQKMALLAAFSNLASLAFNKVDFHVATKVELRIMPPPDIQRPILSSFRQRVAKNLTNAQYQRIQKTNTEAEREAWEAIENELIEASYA